MSRVFVARDLSLDREVVVKVLPPEAARKRLRELEESDVPAPPRKVPER